MILFEDAVSTIMQKAVQTGAERADFRDSLGRVLAEDVVSDIDMPPFDKAAMDGFACRRSDLGDEMKQTGVIAAGDVASGAVSPGECMKIMTGAKVPEGADTVIMVEQSQETREGYVRFTGSRTTPNIAYMGEDVKKGEVVLKKGVLIRPQHIPVLAATGCTRPLVAKRPVVSVIATGDELINPPEMPPPGKIRNSNSFQLEAQIRDMNCVLGWSGLVSDRIEDLSQAINGALEESDVVIVTGGVSAGDFDFVPKVMLSNDVEILFGKVAVKPGRPTVFGLRGKSRIFGLPGNPVSSFIIFETMVKPLLYAMMDHSFCSGEEDRVIGVDLKRKKADRTEFRPVRRTLDGMVVPVEYHGSGHIHAISLADGLMRIPKGVDNIKKGSTVYVRPV